MRSPPAFAVPQHELRWSERDRHERARVLDPLSLLIQGNSGMYFFLGRDYDRAIEREHKALELDAKCNTFARTWR
jgi:hypothetical protein